MTFVSWELILQTNAKRREACLNSDCGSHSLAKATPKSRCQNLWKMSKNRSKIVPKIETNTRKSRLGAVLEHFGEPLGAKMAQERQQERKSMKNVGL